MQNIYKLALDVQDASNPNGVINSLATVIMPAIREEPGYREQGTPYIYTHPAYILFIDKLVSMIPGCYTTDQSGVISAAYDRCHEKAQAVRS